MKTPSILLLCLLFCLGCSAKRDTADEAVKLERVSDANETPIGSTTVLQPEEARDRYEVAILSLAADNPNEIIDAAIQTIGSGGKDAFDALLAHMNNTALASKSFAGQTITVDEDANSQQHQPSIGDVCFELLQGQIEGHFPKFAIEYYVLDRSNIREWLADRKSKTVKVLRIECAQLSLEAAKRAYDQKPTELNADMVQFLEENLARVQAE